MIKKNIFVIENGEKYYGTGDYFDEIDYQKLKKIYYSYKQLNEEIVSLESRRANLPEIVSEGLACILFNACRTNNKKFKCHSSFDCVDENGTSYQIKAVSTLSKNEEGGPTSFGPKSEWDKLVLMHFICENDIVEIYLFDKNIQDIYVNKTQTFAEQCLQGRRPRFSLLKKCHEMKIVPFMTFSFKEDRIIDKNI